MGTYSDTRCGKCGYSFSDGYQYGSSSLQNLGLPEIRCPKCGAVNSTGKKLFFQMSGSAKAFYVIIRIINVIVFTPGVAFVLYFAASMAGLTKEDTSLYEVILFLSIAFIITSVYMFFSSRSEIKKTEEAFKTKDPDYFADI